MTCYPPKARKAARVVVVIRFTGRWRYIAAGAPQQRKFNLMLEQMTATDFLKLRGIEDKDGFTKAEVIEILGLCINFCPWYDLCSNIKGKDCTAELCMEEQCFVEEE